MNLHFLIPADIDELSVTLYHIRFYMQCYPAFMHLVILPFHPHMFNKPFHYINSRPCHRQKQGRVMGMKVVYIFMHYKQKSFNHIISS